MTIVEFVDKIRATFGDDTYWDMHDDGQIIITTNLMYEDGIVKEIQ